jgi:hypothetical protein
MRITFKIDPSIYPIIIITAFLIGFGLAIALGFRPQHGSNERKSRTDPLPAMIQTVPAMDLHVL